MNVLQLVNTRRSFFDTQVDALESVGVDCTVQTVPGVYTSEDGHSVTDYGRFYAKLLARAREDFDVVHANYGLLGPMALAQPTRPVVLTLWGSDVMGHADWLDWVSTRAARGSDAVVVPWRTMSPHLKCAHQVVPFGVDTELFRPMDRDQAREAIGWETDDPVVLFPYEQGRPVKNYERAEEVVERADVGASLRSVSGVPYEEMPYYVNASDALLLTSDRESGPMVLREAAACNVPVVSTDVGVASDFLAPVSNSHVADSTTGLADALTRVLRSGERSNGRAVHDELGIEDMGRRLKRVYQTALANRRG